MSFGFSVGDFLAVISLIDRVASALNSATGSASELRSLVQALSAISTSVKATKDFYSTFDAAITTTEETVFEIAKTVYVAVSEQVRQCIDLLTAFAKVIEPYESALLGDATKVVRRQWKKITWLRKKADLVTFETSLGFHLRAIENHNLLLNMQVFTSMMRQREAKQTD